MDKQKLTIHFGTTSITLPRCRYIVGGEEVANSVQMASGRIVKDVIGVRKTILAEYDYVPARDLKNLIMMLRNGGFFKVEYQDVDGTVKTEQFSIAMPQAEVFRYTPDGTAVWHNVSLEMTGQEVV